MKAEKRVLSESSRYTHFPFTAIVGQETMKRALIFNAIDPTIGGVLITGTRGTAKSTTVRSLAALLPDIEIIKDDPFNSLPDDPEKERMLIPTPFVNLPVGATEDRVLGTLDVERILKTGERRFEAGLLARANRGVLYIDEVNLLPDHLVDVLLDAVAMGVNHIEREGISFEHETRVILVGTMNPEEGELRPQLLDRFGLCVKADGYLHMDQRKEVVKRCIAFQTNPIGFMQQWIEAEDQLTKRIEHARKALHDVCLSDEMLDEIAELCVSASVEGLRADIVIYKTSRAIAAFNKRDKVTPTDIHEAAELALSHRKRMQNSTPPPSANNQSPRPPSSPSKGTQSPSANKAHTKEHKDLSSSLIDQTDFDGSTHEDNHKIDDKSNNNEENLKHFSIGDGIVVPSNRRRKYIRRVSSSLRGKRSLVTSKDRRGIFVRSRLPIRGNLLDIAIEPTLLAAALDSDPVNDRNTFLQLHVEKRHIRVKQRRTPARNLILFVVDASGSMAAVERMRSAKSAVCTLLEEAYQKRDRIALVTFRGLKAEEVLPPTRSAVGAYRKLNDLPTGGRTPLASALDLAYSIIKRELQKESNTYPFLVLVTDGRATVPESNAFEHALVEADRLRQQGVEAMCIDTEAGWLRLRQTASIANRLQAPYHHITDLPSREWIGVVREWIAATMRLPS
jgi:magnesium chelatase subunit D